MHALADLPHVFDPRVLLKPHTLRRRGRARCVKQISDVLRVDGACRALDLGIRYSAAARVDVVERNGATVRARAHMDDQLKPWRRMHKRLEVLEHCEVVLFEKTVACPHPARFGMCADAAELAGCAPGVYRSPY